MARADLCIGCGSCASAEPRAAMDFDVDGHLKPTGPRDWRERLSPALSHACPFSPLAENETQIAERLFPTAPHHDAHIGRFESTWVGHADDRTRLAGSSGGMATWIAAELLRSGEVDGVAHVKPTAPASGRLFVHTISRTEESLREGGKSRYYPVDMAETLREIRAVPGRYAVIGVPCFIKAVQLARAAEPVLAERIVLTIGLFCGHMKSAHLATSFARQMGVAPGEIAAIDYRRKDVTRPANWYTAEVTTAAGERRWRDWWHLAEGDWGSGFFMNPACNWCDDVAAECADVALGDAWLEPYSSDGRGTNVVVVRSPRVAELIAQGRAEGRLQLEPVDADFVRRTQAAGFRQRREGLAWRLATSIPRAARATWPLKRVVPTRAIPLRRKLIYTARLGITRWTPRFWRLSSGLGVPKLYDGWAGLALKLYHAVAYSRGPLGRLVDRFVPPADPG